MRPTPGEVDPSKDLEGGGGGHGREEEYADATGHEEIAHFVEVEGAVFVDVPSAVYGAADGPKHGAGGPEEADDAYDSEETADTLNGIDVVGEKFAGAGEVGLEEVHEVVFERASAEHQAENEEQADGEGEEGEDGVVGDASSHVGGVVTAHFASGAHDEQDDGDAQQGAPRWGQGRYGAAP